jgi:hypothetical protein
MKKLKNVEFYSTSRYIERGIEILIIPERKNIIKLFE